MLATMAAGWLARGLEPDGWRGYDAALRTATPDEVRAAAERYFAPGRLGVLVVEPKSPTR